jgi:DNA segregation ATPase FtsK/SpoIIIE-like protein
LATFHPDDLPFDTSDPHTHVANAIGLVGAYAAWGVLRLFGIAAWSLPFLLLFWAVARWSVASGSAAWTRTAGLLIFLTCVSALLSASASADPFLQVERGGTIGLALLQLAGSYFGLLGTAIISAAIGSLALLMATDFALLTVLARVPSQVTATAAWWQRHYRAGQEALAKRIRQASRAAASNSKTRTNGVGVQEMTATAELEPRSSPKLIERSMPKSGMATIAPKAESGDRNASGRSVALAKPPRPPRAHLGADFARGNDSRPRGRHLLQQLVDDPRERCVFLQPVEFHREPNPALIY